MSPVQGTGSHAAFGGGHFEMDLAVLEMNTEQSEYQSESNNRAAARATKHEHDKKEVEEMHEKADDQMKGAIISGGLEVASGAVQVGSAGAQYDADVKQSNADAWKRASPNLDLDAGPTQELHSGINATETAAGQSRFSASALGGSAKGLSGVGTGLSKLYDAKASHHDADAAGQRHEAETAGAAADEAARRRDHAREDGDKKLAAIQRLMDISAEINHAVLQRA